MSIITLKRLINLYGFNSPQLAANTVILAQARIQRLKPLLKNFKKDKHTMTIDELVTQIKSRPEMVEFQDVIDCIDEHFEYTPTHFVNGRGHDQVINQAGSNEGSCKIFAFATMEGLTEEETLNCFGKYYREDVLQHSEGNDHENIRTFMRQGWSGIQFEQSALLQHQS